MIRFGMFLAPQGTAGVLAEKGREKND